MMVMTALWMKKESEKMPKTMPAEAGLNIFVRSKAVGMLTPATAADVYAKPRMIMKQSTPTELSLARRRMDGRLESGRVMMRTAHTRTGGGTCG